MPNCDGLNSIAWTEATRSERSSAREDRLVSRSARAEESSGEAEWVRERMRR